MEGMYGLQFNNKFLWTTNQCETPMPNGMIFSEIKNLVQTYFSRINKTIWFTGSWNKSIPPHWHHLTFWMAEMLETGAFWPSTNTHIQHLQRHLQRNLEICHHSVFRSERERERVSFSKWDLCWYLTLFIWPLITSQRMSFHVFSVVYNQKRLTTCCCFLCDHDI